MALVPDVKYVDCSKDEDAGGGDIFLGRVICKENATEQEQPSHDHLVYVFVVNLLVLYSLNVLLHAVGLTCLIRAKIRRMSRNQKIYLTSLCIAELLVCLVSIAFLVASEYLDHPVMIAIAACFNIPYYLNMIYITLDRFFEVFLNIKYPILWPPKNTIWLCVTTVVISIIAATIDAFLHGYNINYSPDTYKRYVYPTMDVLFLISASVSYGYIFKKFCEIKKPRIHQPVTPTLSSGTVTAITSIESSKSEDGRSSKKTSVASRGSLVSTKIKTKTNFLHSRFLIIILMGITFVLFMVSTDFIQAARSGRPQARERDIIIDYILYIIKSLSYMSDAIIYILLQPEIRRYIEKCLPSRKKLAVRP